MTTKSVLNRKVQFAFGFAILALVIIGAISYRGMVVSAESSRWVRHTHEVLESLQDLFAALQSLESSTRGFILTGKDSYLESYQANIVRSQQDETTVRNLTIDNSTQQRQIPNLERLA